MTSCTLRIPRIICWSIDVHRTVIHTCIKRWVSPVVVKVTASRATSTDKEEITQFQVVYVAQSICAVEVACIACIKCEIFTPDSCEIEGRNSEKHTIWVNISRPYSVEKVKRRSSRIVKGSKAKFSNKLGGLLSLILIKKYDSVLNVGNN